MEVFRKFIDFGRGNCPLFPNLKTHSQLLETEQEEKIIPNILEQEWEAGIHTCPGPHIDKNSQTMK